MDKIGFYVIPIIILIIVMFGIFNQTKIFDAFISGAAKGLNSTVSLVPSLVGLIVAVSMLKSSGALDMFSAFVSPILTKLHFPSELFPLALLRPISGSGSIALVDNILKTYGPDSFQGKLASVMSGSTETTFYTIAVYFGAVKIKDSKYTIPCALLADSISVVASLITVNYLLSR